MRSIIIDSSNSAAKLDDVKKRMTWLSFMPGEDGVEFWLDDLWLGGGDEGFDCSAGHCSAS